MKHPSTQTELLYAVPSRIMAARPILLAGIEKLFTGETRAGIPQLWQQFAPYLGALPGQMGAIVYGLCGHLFDRSERFRYMAAVEVADLSGVPDAFSAVRLPAQKYAVFPHFGHVSEIYRTIEGIWNQWLPQAEHTPTYMPAFIERYGEDFDPGTGMGSIEIWVPVHQ